MRRYRRENDLTKRSEELLAAALHVAERDGFSRMTRAAVAALAGVSPGTLNHHFGTMATLRNYVMMEAVARDMVEVIAQGLIEGNCHALAARQELKDKAAALLATR